MSLTAPETRHASSVFAAFLLSSLGLLAVSVVSGGGATRVAVGLVVVVTLATFVRSAVVGWPRLIAALILIILFVPIRRYSLPGTCPFSSSRTASSLRS